MANVPEEDYRDYSGTVSMCMYCRRTLRHYPGKYWELVPEYLVKPPQGVSHGLCPDCLEKHFPQGGAAE
jgi:hypothetical protein